MRKKLIIIAYLIILFLSSGNFTYAQDREIPDPFRDAIADHLRRNQIRPGWVFEKTYKGKVISQNLNSIFQTPIQIATIDVPLAYNANLEKIQINLKLQPSKLSTNNGLATTPLQLTKSNFDEVEVYLISPDGDSYLVGNAFHYEPSGSNISMNYPVSKLPGIARLEVSQGRQAKLVHPILDRYGFPTFDRNKKIKVKKVKCPNTKWWGKGNAIFEICSSRDKAAFISRHGIDRATYTKNNLKYTLTNDIQSKMSSGKWTILVRDTRPLLHDSLNRDLMDGKEIALLIRSTATNLSLPKTYVSRFDIKSVNLKMKGKLTPFPSRKNVVRQFFNGFNQTGPIKNAALGASNLIASGVHLSSAEVKFAIMHRPDLIDLNRIRPGINNITDTKVKLVSPTGESIWLKNNPQNGSRYRVKLGSGGIPIPASLKGKLVDGTWKLQIIKVDPETGRELNVSVSYLMSWSLKVSGKSSDYFAVKEIFNGLKSSNQWKTISLHIDEASVSKDNDLIVKLIADNFLTFRHEVEVITPAGSRGASQTIRNCRGNQNPLTHSCFVFGLDGNSIRIKLPDSQSHSGTWKVRWRAVFDPNAGNQNSGGAVEVTGDCPENFQVHGGNASRGLMGNILSKNYATLYGVVLGLSETHLTQNFLAHRILNESQQLPEFLRVYEVGPENRATQYNFNRAPLERTFWDTYRKAKELVQGYRPGMSLPNIRSLSDPFKTAINSGSVSKLLAMEDAMMAAWYPKGIASTFSHQLFRETLSLTKSEKFAPFKTAKSFKDLNVKRSWAMDVTAEDVEYLGQGLKNWAKYTKDIPFVGSIPDRIGDAVIEFSDDIARGFNEIYDGNPPEPPPAPRIIVGDPDEGNQPVTSGGNTPETPEEEDQPSQPETESGGTSGEPSCDQAVQNRCEAMNNCPPHLDQCEQNVEIPEPAKSFANSYFANSQRTDELTLTWGSMAPYINCPPDSGCGAPTVNMLGFQKALGKDPYINCSEAGTSGLCGGIRADRIVCRDWGTGFVDPPRD